MRPMSRRRSRGHGSFAQVSQAARQRQIEDLRPLLKEQETKERNLTTGTHMADRRLTMLLRIPDGRLAVTIISVVTSARLRNERGAQAHLAWPGFPLVGSRPLPTCCGRLTAERGWLGYSRRRLLPGIKERRRAKRIRLRDVVGAFRRVFRAFSERRE